MGENDPMSEFKAATIAFQNATVAFQNASLWATYAQAGVAGLVELVQCVLIAYGLKMVQRSNADRQRQTDLAEKRHEESMLAFTPARGSLADADRTDRTTVS